VRFALEQVGLGVLVGVGIGLVGGWLVAWASRRGWMTGAFQGLALLALALLSWALADQIGGNSFIAAFVGGLAVGPAVKGVGEQLIRFTEAEGQLLSLSVFFVFGALAIGLIQPLSWEVVLYALLSLTAIRVLPVALSLLRVRLAWVSVLFAGWFGPRGLASIVLGLIVVAEAPQLAGRDEIETVVASTVLLSVLLHGITATPLSAAYAGLREWPWTLLRSKGRPRCRLARAPPRFVLKVANESLRDTGMEGVSNTMVCAIYRSRVVGESHTGKG
jgi:NhaP-type Na+/H+ or K+/H+ antiporter